MNTDLCSPAETLPTRPCIVLLLAALIVAVGTAYFWLVRTVPYDGDSGQYIAIASGHIAEVGKPFTARLLQPAVVGFLSRTTGLSIDAAFFVTNAACLAILAAVGVMLVLGQIRSPTFALAIVLCPAMLLRFREIYLPDCMHAALAAVFFLLLVRGLWWYAMPLFTLMQVTRESTVLLTFMFAVVAAVKKKWQFAVVAVLFTVLGIGIVGRFAGQGKGNIHGVNTIVYLVGKVPYSTLLNTTGVRLWTDTHAKADPESYPKIPLWTMQLPAFARFGNIQEMGLYDFEFEIPLANARMILTAFGVMPTVVLLVLIFNRFALLRETDLSPAGLVALTYGGMALLISPALGTAFGRYLSYTWPLAWIVAPELLRRNFDLSKHFLGQLACLQIVASWTPLVLNEQGNGTAIRNLISIGVAIVCHWIAVQLLLRAWIRRPVAGAATER